MRIRDISEPVYDGKYLSHVTISEELRLLSIVLNKKASKDERIFLVGRLKSFGYTKEDTFGVIRKFNMWEGYNDTITERWITFVYKLRGTISDKGSHNPPATSLSWEELKQSFFSKTLPISKLSVPSDPFSAALYYHNMGFHVLPKSDKGKYPLIPWRKYGDVAPTMQELKEWDFSYGVCIIATKKYCFLDIDIPEKIAYSGHAEHTPRGGIHLYAIGEAKSKAISGKGEIKGHGSLIVAYPSEGYRVIQ